MRGLRGAAVALAVGVLALGGCTDEDSEPLVPDAVPEEQPEPSLPSGLQVGVVLPPGDPSEDRQLSDLRTDLRSVAATLPDGVHSMRLLIPEGRDFVRDLAQLMVEDGLDLVCVLGRDGRRIVSEFAETHPGLRYCAVPASASSPPPAATLVEVRFEELGHVAGVAALAEAGDGPVGAVIANDRVGRAAFVDGLEAAVGEDRLLVHAPSDLEAALDAVDEVLEAGAEVVVVDVGEGGVEVVSAAATGARVLTSTSIPATDATVVSWRIRWDAVLRPVLDHLVEVDGDVEVPTSVGLADDVLVVVAEAGASLAVQSAVDSAVRALTAGELDPLEPVEPEDDEDEDDEPEDGEDAPDVPTDGDEG